MNNLIVKSGRNYTPLPIDSTQGFPQGFSSPFGGQTYHFLLYVNFSSQLLDDIFTNKMLPTESAFLVVQVKREKGDGTRETIFLRKVVPNLEYEAENIALTFSTIRIARSNLNGQGNFGSQITGGIAQRWV